MCVGAIGLSKVSPIQTPATLGLGLAADTLTAKKDESSSLRKNLGAVMQKKPTVGVAPSAVLNNMKLG